MAEDENNNENWFFDFRVDKWLADKMRTVMVVVAEKTWTGFRAIFNHCIRDAWKFFIDDIMPEESEAWATMLDAYKNGGFLTQAQVDQLYSLKDIMHPMDKILYVLMQTSLLAGVLDVTLDSSKSFMGQTINKKMRPGLPAYHDIIQSAFIAPEKTTQVREVMKKQGIPDEYIDLVFLSMYRLYDEEMIKTLYLRGVLSDDEMINRMQELGYTETRIKEIVQSWNIIPGPSDLLHMVGKEAFEQDAIDMMGLDDEFPEEQVQWLAKQGLSEYWARKYWYAHWEQPSIQMGFEMLHRDVIGWPELNMLFKTVEIPPYWRDKLTQIAYSPLTRVDVRRMHASGVLDENGVFNAYKALGYNDENAGLMLDFTLKYNATDAKELSKSQVIKAYRNKAMDASTAQAFLENLGYPAVTAEYLLAFEDYEENLEWEELQVNNIKDSYTNNLITRASAQEQLDAMDLPATQVELLLAKWDIVVYKNKKIPSKTDLMKFLQNGQITTDEFRREMEKLGYNYTYAQWYEEYALGKGK